MDDRAGPALRSILLGSADPTRLSRWYAEALAVRTAHDGRFDLGGVTVFVGRRDGLTARNVQPDRVILNIAVDDLDVVESRLIAMRAAWAREVEWDGCTRIGTVLDPDGNYVQVMEATGMRP